MFNKKVYRKAHLGLLNCASDGIFFNVYAALAALKKQKNAVNPARDHMFKMTVIQIYI